MLKIRSIIFSSLNLPFCESVRLVPFPVEWVRKKVGGWRHAMQTLFSSDSLAATWVQYKQGREHANVPTVYSHFFWQLNISSVRQTVLSILVLCSSGQSGSGTKMKTQKMGHLLSILCNSIAPLIIKRQIAWMLRENGDLISLLSCVCIL